jgi:hypothetical protein
MRAAFWELSGEALKEHFAKTIPTGSTAVVPFGGADTLPAIRPAGAAPVARPARARLSFRSYDDFMPAFSLARGRVIREVGDRWWMTPDYSRWARVPAAWVNWKGQTRSGTSPRDMHFPLGRFWPNGELPLGPHYAAPVSVAQFADRAPVRFAPVLELTADGRE